MIVVWYTEKRFFVYNGGDGEFDYLTAHRDIVENGMSVSVKSGGTLPFDKAREEAITLKLADLGLLSPLDVYKGLHMPNPQQLYDNWAKYKTDPQSLARTAMDEQEDSAAYMDFIELMAGKNAKPREDAKTEHILSHRKQMLTDQFLKADTSKQILFLKHLQVEFDSLMKRTALDTAAQQGGAEALDLLNPQPAPQPQPPMPQMMPMAGAPSATLPQMGGVPPVGMPLPQPPMGGMGPVQGQLTPPPMQPSMIPQAPIPQPLPPQQPPLA
jgi:hypothetical protein